MRGAAAMQRGAVSTLTLGLRMGKTTIYKPLVTFLLQLMETCKLFPRPLKQEPLHKPKKKNNNLLSTNCPLNI
jgi:hypothetical protein